MINNTTVPGTQVPTPSDFIWVLKSLRGPQSKTLRLDETGQITKLPPTRLKYFKASRRDVHDLESLHLVTTEISSNPDLAYIGGEPRPGADVWKIRRTLSGPDADLQRRPRRWVVLDIDKSIATHVDVINRPEVAIQACMDRITQTLSGSVLAGVSFSWSLSSTCGLRKAPGGTGAYIKDPTVLKTHIKFWLDEPMDEAPLKAWIKSINRELGVEAIDPALCAANQLHYGAPRLIGFKDWLPRRHGLFRLVKDLSLIHI